ncbi:hypothetical protein [Vibrio splendidus]|uniref:hypothetical protein n=1 Tax=Vibrio splendidus TaxID=29497 RepID=UPI0020A4974C|nr:hypothetical protein [Vibrio splendidus]
MATCPWIIVGVDCETRKHVVCLEQVIFFSGDEHPIILAQAVLLALISDEEYIQLAQALDERDEIGLIAVTENTGALIDIPIGNNATTGELVFTGWRRFIKISTICLAFYNG